MTKRDILQEKFAEIAYNKEKGILFLSARFGKCRVIIRMLEKLPVNCRILICYPEGKIRNSWEKEFEEEGYINSNIIYSSFISIHKWENQTFDVIIIDEIHLLSEAQIEAVAKLDASQRLREAKFWLIGLSGTISLETQKELNLVLKMPIIASYTREQAIADGIVTNYEINIISVPLDNQRLIQYKKSKKTEKKQFDSYSYIINKLKAEGRNFKFLALARMRIIQGSIAKLEKTKELLKELKDERVLVFCGLIKIAEQLGIPVHHSKSEDSISSFIEGEGNHLAVIKIGASGSTYKPLDRVIINYFTSNPEDLEQRISRAMSLEYDNPEKIAKITIITSNEPVELNWLNKALDNFPKEKIKWIK